MAAKLPLSSNQTRRIVDAAIVATPGWVLGVCGGMVTMSVCMVLVLQLGGFAGPIGRILNAEAAKIERAAERIDASASNLDQVVERVNILQNKTTELDARVDTLERKVKHIEALHNRLGVE